jgi:hypothetical protein
VGRECGTHGKGEKYTRFGWESPKERYHSEYKGVDGIRMDLSEIGFGGGIGFDWLRIGIIYELL